ncbi:amino acid adenylation domain-containing protein [Flavobacterium jejuense]|uniref:Amino acid adenylation domain-containing protein n=1 Tax=Flavobacterium jejuense TaxID=1544455 RepID=A0ABX0IQ28_9FLAO|nr:non-ribosomal peptide synthetase/type I polyketide synthase [Flavobacterium jejuense]NHN25922.1 amino acid adenylation domain-containing protein [Flavobacterium jejuense]
MEKYTGLEIAIIGMSGRFPEADNINQYWENLKNGKDCISDFSKEEIINEGELESLVNDPLYVRSNAYLKNKKYFDSDFFGYTPHEAELMDPQVRIYHECCWEALEDSGYSVMNNDARVGVFASGSPSTAWQLFSLRNNQERFVDDFTASHLRDATFLSSRISYKFNLKGPAVFIQTACSSSLVAIHEACNSLLLGECTMALAGGVNILNYSKKGYLYQEGMIHSKDGRCRPFDVNSSGTVGGEGAGVVVLKRLKDAIRDRDNIYSIIKGTAINNDGNSKVGYTAPSVKGQVEVIKRAHKMAKVEQETISYIEAHGTATSLGDSIEIEALNEVFGNNKMNTCAIGSVKSSIGHLDTAASVAGFIKTVLAIKNKQIPASLHFTEPNPRIDFNNGPFYVNNELKNWDNNKGPLRAGVSAFGIGGTNAHVVLQEAPTVQHSSETRKDQLIVLSAKTKKSLDENTSQLSEFLKMNKEASLADIAFTLQSGRDRFNYRKMFVCDTIDNAINLLERDETTDVLNTNTQEDLQNVIFMFPGQGSQYINMCKDLYLKEKDFKNKIDECFSIVKNYSSEDFKSILFPNDNQEIVNPKSINDTEYAQPLLFIIEYSIAWLFNLWGIKPNYMIGHSIGEYVAACVSGVFSLEDAIRLVIKRGEVMGKAEKGSMLSVTARKQEIEPLLNSNKGIDLAVINSESSLVVSGTDQEIENFQRQMINLGYQSKRIHTSHAFHSYMMDSILSEFENEFFEISINEPKIPYISNVTGSLVTYDQISKPSYWSKHLRGTVDFFKGSETLLKMGNASFMEIGPGRTLSNYLAESKLLVSDHHIINTIRHSKQEVDDQKYIIEKLGSLWLKGIKISWDGFYSNEERNKVSLPTYSFEKLPYTTNFNLSKLLDSQLKTDNSNENEIISTTENHINITNWKRSLLPNAAIELIENNSDFLVFYGDETFSPYLIQKLVAYGQNVVQVKTGSKFEVLEDGTFQVNMNISDEITKLWDHLMQNKVIVKNIIYCATLEEELQGINYDSIQEKLNKGYLGLSNIAKSLASTVQTVNINITVISNHLANVSEEDKVDPLKSVIHAPARIIPSEITNVKCKVIDIPYPFQTEKELKDYTTKIENEIFYNIDDPYIAYRYNERWVESVENFESNEKINSNVQIIKDGVYVIVGGLGGIGLSIANELALQYGANIVIVHRSDFPKREDWNNWLKSKGDQDTISKKIQQIVNIESIGSNVYLYQVDVSNEEKVQKFIEQINSNHSKLNGMIWAAGEVDYGGIILNRSEEDFINYSSSKIHGLLLFEKYMDFSKLDFLALFSSIGNVIYQVKFGQVGYNAGNEFLENYAHYARKLGINAFTINWCDWLNVGLTVESVRKAEKINDIQLINSKISSAIYPKEGVEIFFKCLQNKAAVYTIYPENLQKSMSLQKNRLNEVKNGLSQTINKENITLEPTNNLKQTLVELYTTFFGKNVGVKDDFFELGGDSLKAMSLVARINQKIGSSLSIGDIYKHPAINDLLIMLANIDSKHKNNIILKAQEQEYYLASSEQKRMYFLQTIDKESVLYNETEVLWTLGNFDKNKVEKIFRQLIERHESLRTSLVIVNDELKQYIIDEFSFELEYLKYDENKYHETIQSFVRPFDLTKAPLLRVGIMEKNSNEHLMIIDSHHIVLDGISRFVLREEFNSLYNGEELPELKLQYKDYAEWQHSTEQQEVIDHQKEFWINEFSGEITPLELPTDYPRSFEKKNEGDFVKFKIAKKESLKLKKVASDVGATMFTVLLSTLNILLSRLGSKEDIAIGTPVSGRQNADLEGLIGMFVNTICLRNYPKGNIRFNDFLSDVKSKTLACLENQSYPFEELVNDLKLERDDRRNPLFDVMFVYQNYEDSKQVTDGLIMKPENFKITSSRFDLTLLVIEEKDELYLRFIYSTELFKRETAERFADYFKKIITTITENASVKLSDIDIISSSERKKLLIDFNNTKVELCNDSNILDLFMDQVAKTPNNIALQHGNQSVSYKELNDKADVIAHMIDSRLEGANHKIGLHFNHSVEMVASLLGVIKSGGAYIPLSAEDPIERKQYILSNCEADLLLIQEELYDQNNLDSHLIEKEKILVVSEINVTKKSLSYPRKKISPDDLIYIIYTSGTTGNPKGVEVKHRNLVNYTLWNIDYHKLSQEDVGLQLLSYHFDGFGSNFYPALLSGGTLVTVPNEYKLDAKYITDTIISNKVSFFAILPGLFDAIVDEITVRNASTDLRFVVLAGEKSTVNLINKSNKILPGLSLENHYGPTETTIGSTHHLELNQNTISIIGQPIWNTSIYILDTNSNLLPIGVVGEICIAGSGVAKGYINNPLLTAEKFIDNPFASKEKMYRTGDAGRWLSNGTIEIVGRIDDQVKIRGYRIELGEIGNQISAFDEIDKAVVVVNEKNDNKYLSAYYISPIEINLSMLKEFLSSRIPEYMIPTFFTRLEELPYTLNGKLDKKALPEPEMYISECVASSTFEEELLVEVWTQVLVADKIGVTDNFFSVGGDSIKSIQISSRLRSLGYEVSVKDILTSQNIRVLATKLRVLESKSDQSMVTGEIILSPIQKWFFSKNTSDQHHFNQSVMLNFTDGIQEETVKAIFYKLQTHHDALRMVYKQDNGKVMQENKSITDSSVSIRVFNLEGEENSEELLFTEAEKMQSSIDIYNGSLMKLGLFHMNTGSRLLVIIHHLVVDGVSWRILLEDIDTLYQQIIKKETLLLPLKTDSFKSWTKNLQHYLKSKTFENSKIYWDNVIQNNVKPLKKDNPDGENTFKMNKVESFKLSKETTASLLSEVHVPFKTQINDILLSALLLSLNRLYNHNEFLIDLEGHGRQQLGLGENIDRTVGWFTSFYPILLEKKSNIISNIIKHVKETLRQVPNNGMDYIIRKYFAETSSEYQSKDEVTAQISFNYLGQFDNEIEGNSFCLAYEAKGDEVSKNKVRDYDWDVSGIVSNGELSMGIMYSSQQYSKETIEKLMAFYNESILEIVEYCCNYNNIELTPSDLTFKDITSEQLIELQEKYEIQDIYPLSPMQEGMLFHSMFDSKSDGYFGQMSFEIDEKLDMEVFERSMNDLVARHDIFRTVFLYEGYERSIQLVLKEKKINIEFNDIRDELINNDLQEVIQKYKSIEKLNPFNLQNDMLMRLRVLQISEKHYAIIWNYHHILMDGWCTATILNEFREIYSKNKRGQDVTLQLVNPYLNYIEWLENKDKESSQKYWKKVLDGFDRLTSFPKKEIIKSKKAEHKPDFQYLTINEEHTSMLNQMASDYGVTINTIIQFVWGMLLAKYNNVDDVVFGTVVSGRPAEIEGIENMIGLFINAIPVRIKYGSEDSLDEILHKIQNNAIENDEHQYHPLSEIQSLSTLGRNLLDHIIVVENYPVIDESDETQSAKNRREDFPVKNVQMYVESNYDLVLVVIPENEIQIKIEYNTNVYENETISNILNHFNQVIHQVMLTSEIV